MDLRRKVEFFDRFESSETGYDALGETAYRRLLHRFEEAIHPRPSERCVDLGCGTGAFTRRLSHYGLRLVGMDISAGSIRRAAAASSGERYVVGDIRATGLPDQSVDIVVYSGVLHHFPSSDDRLSVLREGRRILVKGGRLFAFDPSRHSPAAWLYRDPRSPFRSKAGRTENEIHLSRDGTRRELRTAGFEAVDIRGTGSMTFRFIEGRFARFVLPLYNFYEIVLGTLPLQRRFGTFLITTAWAP